ncbi:MAG: M23 family metallopeptidase [Gammaproteobacteria bacterium]
MARAEPVVASIDGATAGRPAPGWLKRSDIGTANADHDDNYVYALPYAVGRNFPVLQGYGSRLSHRGAESNTVDFGMPAGTPVHSAREGKVVLVEQGFAESCWEASCEKVANFIVIQHADGTTGQYFHLRQGSVVVRVGQSVARGDKLASSGNTGYSSTPHLHFGVYRRDSDGALQSIPVRFAVRGSVIDAPRAGARYTNAAAEHDGRIYQQESR